MENKYEKTIEVAGDKITIRKLALEDYATLIKKLSQAKESIKIIFDMGEITKNKIIYALPEIIGNAFPQFVDILSFASGVSKKKFQKQEDGKYYGLPEAVEILRAVLEVNDFDGIKKNIRNILPKAKQITANQKKMKTGSKK